MLKITQSNGRTKCFAEIEDFPYANTLSVDAYNSLKADLELKIEKYYKQRKFIAMMLAKKDKALKMAA